MKIDLTNGVKYIIDTLSASGYEAYVVGGAVRNSLISRAVDDFDITTSAAPCEIKEAFKHLRTIDTGIKHGTVTVIYEGAPYEITTYRVDGEYDDNRHPASVEFTRNLKDDLARRDFTVNAMCYNDTLGLVDLYGGREDLANKTIRTVGDPTRRFTEDALRVLRALRFASVLNFEIEEGTSRAIRELYHLLANVSNERILSEMKKLLAGDGAYRVVSDYFDVIGFIFTELCGTALPNREGFLSADVNTRLAAIFILNSDSPALAIDAALQRLRSDNKTRNLLSGAINAYFNAKFDTVSGILRGLARYGADEMTLCANILALINADNDAPNRLSAILCANPVYRVRDLSVGGKELESLGYRGTEIGNALERVLYAVIDGECTNSREAIFKFLAR